MPKFIINEVREITVEAEIIADSAQEALFLYKNLKGKSGTTATEESHITVTGLEEEQSNE